MRNTILAISFLFLGSAAWATDFACHSRSQHFVIKEGDEQLYLVYECNNTLTGCMPAKVFSALGFESQGSFELIGQRATGQRVKFTMVKSKEGWTATLSTPYNKNLIDVLKCEPYK